MPCFLFAFAINFVSSLLILYHASCVGQLLLRNFMMMMMMMTDDDGVDLGIGK